MACLIAGRVGGLEPGQHAVRLRVCARARTAPVRAGLHLLDPRENENTAGEAATSRRRPYWQTPVSVGGSSFSVLTGFESADTSLAMMPPYEIE